MGSMTAAGAALIHLHKRSPRLEVQDLGNLRTGEDAMTAFDPFGEADPNEDSVR